MLDKTPQSLPPSITHERCNATRKDNSARLGEDTRTGQGLCLSLPAVSHQKRSRLTTNSSKEQLQLGQPESSPGRLWASGDCPAPPRPAPSASAPKLRLLLLSFICGFPECRAKSLHSCPSFCDPVDCNPPGSSVHGILQARILEWVAISFSVGVQSYV